MKLTPSRNFTEFDDFGQKSKFHNLKDEAADFSFEDTYTSTELLSNKNTPIKNSPTITLTPASVDRCKGSDLTEHEKLDQMLSMVSGESDMMSEDLLMNENIDFLFEQNSDKHSMVSTSLNYTASEMPLSTFGTFAFPNSIQQSFTQSHNESSVFHLNRCETHEPQISFDHSKGEIDPSDRYKTRPFTFSEKTGNFLKVPGEDGVAIRTSCEVSFESVKGKPKADPKGDSKCCTGCRIT